MKRILLTVVVLLSCATTAAALSFAGPPEEASGVFATIISIDVPERVAAGDVVPLEATVPQDATFAWAIIPSEKRVTVVLAVSDSGKVTITSKKVQVGPEVPLPDPLPDPPPPPGQKWQVVFIYERDQLDNLLRGQQLVLSSLVFRSRLEKAGHKLVGIVDQHIKDVSKGGVLAPFFAAVKGDPLPRMCIAPLKGGKILDFPFADEAEVFKLLETGGR